MTWYIWSVLFGVETCSLKASTTNSLRKWLHRKMLRKPWKKLDLLPNNEVLRRARMKQELMNTVNINEMVYVYLSRILRENKYSKLHQGIDMCRGSKGNESHKGMKSHRRNKFNQLRQGIDGHKSVERFFWLVEDREIFFGVIADFWDAGHGAWRRRMIKYFAI